MELLYGSGLRLDECIRLRVKDVDLDRNLVIVHEGKGDKDRAVPLSAKLEDPLRLQIKKLAVQHEIDIRNGYGDINLPYGLSSKYPRASKEFAWQYIFPASKISKDPRSGTMMRHHLDDSTIQRSIKIAIRKITPHKNGSAHSFRHSSREIRFQAKSNEPILLRLRPSFAEGQEPLYGLHIKPSLQVKSA